MSELTMQDIAHFNLTKHVACADCGRKMVLKKGHFGPFYSCSGYPGCKATHRANKDGSPAGQPASSHVKQMRARAYELLREHCGEEKMANFLRKRFGLRSRRPSVAQLTSAQLTVLINKLEDLP